MYKKYIQKSFFRAAHITMPVLLVSLLMLEACGGEDHSGSLTFGKSVLFQASVKVNSKAVASQTCLEKLKQQVIQIASENTNRIDNLEEVRQQLDPLVAKLGQYFAKNRPENEIGLLRGAWKNLWFDDVNIGASSMFELDRTSIYQVVGEGYYYNIANNTLSLPGQSPQKVHSYLKGNYVLTNLPNKENVGQSKLNVIDLEFDDNKLRYGPIPTDAPLETLVNQVEQNAVQTMLVPGPKGVTGELWNMYLDQDLRISLGSQDGDPGVTDLFILQRTIYAD